MTIRIYFTKTYISGPKAGQSVQTHLPYPVSTWKTRFAEKLEASNNGTVLHDKIADGNYVIKNVYAVEDMTGQRQSHLSMKDWLNDKADYRNEQ